MVFRGSRALRTYFVDGWWEDTEEAPPCRRREGTPTELITDT
jgi:hypothetical protein